MNNLDFDKINNDKWAIALKLDQEEQELLESIEGEEWVSISDVKEEIKRFQNYATQQLDKQRIEIKISSQDADMIYALSSQSGKSVSSLAEEIIHQYLVGELVKLN
jgi:predicted DNA binding CopG/RHH family protein